MVIGSKENCWSEVMQGIQNFYPKQYIEETLQIARQDWESCLTTKGIKHFNNLNLYFTQKLSDLVGKSSVAFANERICDSIRDFQEASWIKISDRHSATYK